MKVDLINNNFSKYLRASITRISLLKEQLVYSSLFYPWIINSVQNGLFFAVTGKQTIFKKNKIMMSIGRVAMTINNTIYFRWYAVMKNFLVNSLSIRKIKLCRALK